MTMYVMQVQYCSVNRPGVGTWGQSLVLGHDVGDSSMAYPQMHFVC